jgi:MSHA biogenesis protein MshP
MRHSRQQGFALIAAVFLITVIAAIAFTLASISSSRGLTTVQNLEAARAYYAAYSGIQVAATRAIAGTCANASVSIEGYTVDLGCTALTGQSEGATTYSVYTVTSQARRGAWDEAVYVSRRLRASVTDAP